MRRSAVASTLLVRPRGVSSDFSFKLTNRLLHRPSANVTRNPAIQTRWTEVFIALLSVVAYRSPDDTVIHSKSPSYYLRSPGSDEDYYKTSNRVTSNFHRPCSGSISLEAGSGGPSRRSNAVDESRKSLAYPDCRSTS